jgi:PKD repeat protein
MRTRLTAALSVLATLFLLATACTTPPTGPGTPNLLPVAVVAASPTSGTAPLQVEFSASSSADPDGSIATYAWTFGDGGTATGMTPTHTYAQVGTYTARLTVTDNRGGTDADQVTIEVARDFSAVVLVDDDGADDPGCGTLAVPCATLDNGLDRAATDGKSAVWVAEGSYPRFTVVSGVDVIGGYDPTFSGPGGTSQVTGSFDPASGVSAAFVALDISDPTIVAGLTAQGGNESTTGRSSLAAYVGGAGNGLQLDDLTLTGGATGAAATALLVDGASTVGLTAPTISSGDAVGAGNSAYGIRALNGSTVVVEGGTIESGAAAPGASAGSAPVAGAAGCNGPNGANAGGASSPGAGGAGCSGTSPTNSGAGGTGGDYSGSGRAGSAGGGGAAGGSGGCPSLFGCGGDATGGAAGSVGTAGNGGVGGAATFTATALFSGQSGSAGTVGTAGAGGGGGGGGKSASASGGGGGAGGGAGAGGAAATIGGGAGGGSFGVYAVNATVQLTAVDVTAGQGGAGGSGQPGGAGGKGGNGGSGGNKSCCEAGGGGGGGAGGAGGGGGGAGGGAAGPSIGVLHSGSGTVTMTGSSLGAASGTASGGNGGAGGAAGAAGNGGAPGNCALIGGCGPTPGANSGQGNSGGAGTAGAAGQRLGSWDNGATTEPDQTGTPTTTTTTTTTTTAPPAAVRTAVAMTCSTSAAGQTSIDANATGASVLAPATVAAGSQFQVELTPDPMSVPTSGGGYPIGFISNVRYSYVVPAGATFVGATVSGGSNLGSGTPSVALNAGKVTLTVPGNLAAGTTANFPTVTATFTATGAAGSTIETRYAGSSYNDPGLIFQTRVNNVPLLGSVTSTSNCYAPVNPVLSTTTIN